MADHRNSSRWQPISGSRTGNTVTQVPGTATRPPDRYLETRHAAGQPGLSGPVTPPNLPRPTAPVEDRHNSRGGGWSA